MELFNELNKMMTKDSRITITVTKKSDSQLIAMTFVDTVGLEDPAAGNIPPFRVSGSPEELDKEFVNALKSPISSAVGLQTNMKDFEEGLKKAEAQRKKDTEAKNAEASAKEKEFDKAIAAAEDAMKKKNWKSAIENFVEAKALADAIGKSSKFTASHKTKLETAHKELKKAGPSLNFGTFSDEEQDSAAEETSREKTPSEQEEESPATDTEPDKKASSEETASPESDTDKKEKKTASTDFDDFD